MKNSSRYDTMQVACAVRAKLWREFVASYQKVLEGSPVAFSAFCAEFRERFIRATPND